MQKDGGAAVSPFSQVWFPLLVLVISLTSTVFLWRIVERGRIERAEQHFQRESEEIASRLINRLHDHEQVLLGANALFHVKGDTVTRSDWRHYVSALSLDENHPGILGVAYSAWLSPSQIEAHVREIRAEGFPEYVIRPAGRRPVYTSIIWIEPFNWRNQRAFGYDMYSEPVRREAMSEARDTGETSIAARVTLVQETDRDPQYGMLMYVPSYRQGMQTDTVEARRAALRGFVYSPIRMNDFVQGTLDRLPSDLDFTIHVGESLSDASFMFSTRHVEQRHLPADYRPAFSAVKTVEDYGVKWLFTFSTRPEFDVAALNPSRSIAILLVGVLSSFLLASLAFVQARSRRQALAVADERLQADARIRETLDRLKLATEVAGIGIWTWNFNDGALKWDERLFDWYDAPGALRRSGPSWEFWRSRVHPDDLERLETTLGEARRNGSRWEGEFRIVLPNGRTRSVHAASIIEGDRLGRPVRMIGINLDISRQRELEKGLRLAKEAAEEANRAKSEFLANMSHEIRTPMTVFLAALEHLQELEKDPERRQLLEMADLSAHRLRSLIEDILDFSKIEARRIELHEEPVRIRACVEEAVALLRLPAGEKNLEMHIAIAPEVPETVIADPDRLIQVLVNLVGNAVKFTERGQVKVSVSIARQDLLFSVSDTGTGIPAEKQGLLFQSFSQVDSSRTRRHGGTGLGLAISKGLVDLMGGVIWLESSSGSGSTFSFSLPLKTSVAPSRPPADPTERDYQTPERSTRILLAEDEPAVREMIRMVIERLGYGIEAVENGEQAIAKWQEGDFDLVLMDVQMPRLDGMEAARTIRRLEEEHGKDPTCIIALTAHARRETEEECLAAGMNTFLTKPLDKRILQDAIEECLPG